MGWYIRKSIDRKFRDSAKVIARAIMLLIESNENVSKKALENVIYEEMNMCFWRILYDKEAREDLKDYIQKVDSRKEDS